MYEQKKPFFLYTGRGPSNESMHLGHSIPFIFCQWLQEVFDVHLVIQLTDDEKFHFKENLTLEDVKQFALENAKDIIAFGFNPEKTFIFMDSQYYGYMFDTILKVQKCLNFNQCSSVFGFNESSSIGKLSYPCAEIATAFASAFPHIFNGPNSNSIPSLIPCAIDQVKILFLTYFNRILILDLLVILLLDLNVRNHLQLCLYSSLLFKDSNLK